MRHLAALAWLLGCSGGARPTPARALPPPVNQFTEGVATASDHECIAASELARTTREADIVATLAGDLGKSRGLQRVQGVSGVSVEGQAVDAVVAALADPRLATAGFGLQGPGASSFRAALIARGVAENRLRATPCPGTPDRIELVRSHHVFDQAAAETIARAAYAMVQGNRCGELRDLAVGALEWREFGMRGDELRDALKRIDTAIADCRDWGPIARNLTPARVTFDHITAKAGGKVEGRATRADLEGYVVDLIADHDNRPWRFRTFVVQIGQTGPGVTGIDVPGSSCWTLAALCDDAGDQSRCHDLAHEFSCQRTVQSLCRHTIDDDDQHPITLSTHGIELCQAWTRSH